MIHTVGRLALILVLFVFFSGSAYAERISANPITGETVTLFGTDYTVNGIDVTATTFQGNGAFVNTLCMGLGSRLGATAAQDQIFVADESGADGEDLFILTGVDSTTFTPTAAASTSSFIANTTSNGFDPAGIEWINDNNAGASDPNYRFPRGASGSSLFELSALDLGGIVWPDYLTLADTDTATDSYVGMGMCKNALDDTATRLYYGGVDRDSGLHFAYMAFDLSTNSFVSAHSVLLDGIGTPDDPSTSLTAERSLRALGFDGTYYYVMAKKPGVGESWLYRFTTFPDPAAGADIVHPETPQSAQLDNAAGGVAWPTTPADAANKGGLTFGRVVNGKPVIYISCSNYLYTLVPQLAATPTPTNTPLPGGTPTAVPTISTQIQSDNWGGYR